MLKGLYIVNKDIFERIYGADERKEIEALVDIYAPLQDPNTILQDPSVLHDAEVIFLTWGAPMLNEAFLQAAPNLKAVFYAAGSIKGFTPPEFWERNIKITSAYGANAVPVAEFTVSQILYCMKCGWHITLPFIREHTYPKAVPLRGSYQTTVGIISLGMIGSMVCRKLESTDLNILAYDPYADPDNLPTSKVKLASLDEVFKESDVVSLHTPWLKETEAMITGDHIASMKPYSSFINTSRGAIVREEEMISVLKERPDIVAVLDVTWPEPPAKDSELLKLPNVVITPHIAGSMASEWIRMGRYMADELKRFANGEEMIYAIDREKAARLA